MVADGPRPGRMPTTVPSTAPINAKVRLVRVKAIPKPPARPWNISRISSILLSLRVPKARGKGHLEEILEYKVQDRGDGDGDGEQGNPADSLDHPHPDDQE